MASLKKQKEWEALEEHHGGFFGEDPEFWQEETGGLINPSRSDLRRLRRQERRRRKILDENNRRIPPRIQVS